MAKKPENKVGAGDESAPTEVQIGGETMAEEKTESVQPEQAPDANAQLAEALKMFSQVLERQAPPSSINAYAEERFATMQPGGKFIVNNRWVDSLGQPLEVSQKDQAYVEDLRKRTMAAQQKMYELELEEQ